jgi:hypothetical protein
MLDTPAPTLFALDSLTEPTRVRKYHFRNFEDRRGGTDRRARSCDQESRSCRRLPDADDERLTADEAAGRPRRET